MQDKNLIRDNKKNQTLFSDLLKPWDEWIDNGILFRTGHTPAVNIIEEKLRFIVTLAAPGLKKSDFKIFLGMSHLGPLVPCWYYTMLSRN